MIRGVRETHRLVRTLETVPLLFEAIPEKVELGVDYRHIIHGNYRIIYQVLQAQVIVVRIIHAARLPRPGMFRGVQGG